MKREEFKVLLFLHHKGIIQTLAAILVAVTNLLATLQGIQSWIADRQDNLQNNDFEHGASLYVLINPL